MLEMHFFSKEKRLTCRRGGYVPALRPTYSSRNGAPDKPSTPQTPHDGSKKMEIKTGFAP
jgi:hypothetical protein